MSATVTAPSDTDSFQTAVLEWYRAHGRSLNFRQRRDPYSVLVSETMAQQTQISRVEPTWAAFLERFPTPQALAVASAGDVLRAWAGMGYNRRALNLRRAIQIVVRDFGGVFPSTVEGLAMLPGVGPYTARAVAAIAYGSRVGAVDTNVRRVVGRIGGGWQGLRAHELQILADGLVPDGRAGEWTHALMDIGARFCRPVDVRCPDCPAGPWCRAAASFNERPGNRRARGEAADAGSPMPFTSTTRWLRGRIIDGVRAADGDTWVRFEEPIGSHNAEAVAAAVAGLAAEGLLERHPSDAALARLPQ